MPPEPIALAGEIVCTRSDESAPAGNYEFKTKWCEASLDYDCTPVRQCGDVMWSQLYWHLFNFTCFIDKDANIHDGADIDVSYFSVYMWAEREAEQARAAEQDARGGAQQLLVGVG